MNLRIRAAIVSLILCLGGVCVGVCYYRTTNADHPRTFDDAMIQEPTVIQYDRFVSSLNNQWDPVTRISKMERQEVVFESEKGLKKGVHGFLEYYWVVPDRKASVRLRKGASTATFYFKFPDTERLVFNLKSGGRIEYTAAMAPVNISNAEDFDQSLFATIEADIVLKESFFVIPVQLVLRLTDKGRRTVREYYLSEYVVLATFRAKKQEKKKS